HRRFAGHDSDADRKPKLRGRLVQLGDGVEHAKRTAHRSLRVILVHVRYAEHGHDAVADELVHRPAQPFDLPAEPRVVRAQEGPHVLRVGLVGAGGEADQVAEQHRDDLALLHDGARTGAKQWPATSAEPKAPRILLAAARAPHEASSMALT